jgi:ABC-type branched-subunit amino acid transport system ATPase component
MTESPRSSATFALDEQAVDARSLLVTEGLSRSFGGVQALADVSIEVEENSLTSVVGPNGAGKTTLFNVISGLMSPTTGSVWFKGGDVTGWASYRITSAGVGRTFQNVRLFENMNVLENVMAARYCRTHGMLVESLFFLPRSRREMRANKALALELLTLTGVDDSALRLPGELPYGERRRVEIARALATEPDLLMLDEPFAGMTHEESWSLVKVLEQFRTLGKTIFLIEHNMDLVMSVSDKVIVLNFGRKLAEGAPSIVRDNPAVLEAYLGVD